MKSILLQSFQNTSKKVKKVGFSSDTINITKKPLTKEKLKKVNCSRITKRIRSYLDWELYVEQTNQVYEEHATE
jgi:hypothetical protein